MTTIFSGQIHDVTNNRMVGPGEDYVRTEGSTHYLVCVGTEDCIYASRAMNGIALGGPGGPRVQPTRGPGPRKS
jgi:hypothetical protein